MQFTSMSPKKRYSSGTLITINHNLLPIYISLSTPCFNFFIDDNECFAPLVLSFSFYIFRTLTAFPLSPNTMLYILPPSKSLYLSIPTSQFNAVTLSVSLCSSWVGCCCTNLFRCSVTNKLTSPHQALPSILRGPPGHC